MVDIIAGLSDHQMNRVVDEHLVPDVLVGQQGGTRLFTRLCAAFARFYFDTEDLLIAGARRQVLEELTSRVTRSPAREAVLALAQVPPELSWKVARCAVEIDVAPYVSTALVRAREVDQAEALITTDTQVLGGAPVFAGTRVPIDNVLASLDAGIQLPRLQDSFPFLTQAHVGAARVYSEVHPRRGRPRRLGETQPGCRAPQRPRGQGGARMTLRLLIDECLSPELVQLAVAAGHVESTCVRDRG